MEKGFNSDIIYRGLNFHVQTEDWGSDNPYLVSRVYQYGAVIKSVKTPYADVLGFGQAGAYGSSFGTSIGSSHLRRRPDPQAIQLALRAQHEKILDLLVGGQLF